MNDFGESSKPLEKELISADGLELQLSVFRKDVKLQRRPTSHIHKNDEGYGLVIREVNDGLVESDRPRVGLVVGNGAILSTLPEVPADVLVISDYNPFIHEWTEYSINALMTANSPEEYRALVYTERNPLYKELIKEGVRPEEGLRDEMQDLGDRHFLSGSKRFAECKESLLKKRLLMLAVDLTDRKLLSRISEVLRRNDIQITFANLTNVWEHAGNVLETSLSTLPFHEQAVILHSSRAYTDRFNPKMMGICRGLSSYIDIAKSANQFWRNYGRQAGGGRSR